MGTQYYYRGNLTSCNYSCDYCPFAKRKNSANMLAKDENNLKKLIERMKCVRSSHALLITPYGEALIHSYYWTAIASLTQIPSEELTGCQTNLSFPVEKMLTHFTKCGGHINKLCLWCTFHPLMTGVSEFVKQCSLLSEWGVTFSVGAVGNPRQIDTIKKLRDELPASIYLWINKMDGLNRPYSAKEISAFHSIDPYFSLELKHYKADIKKCSKAFFLTADEERYYCNLHAGSHAMAVADKTSPSSCYKECSCYLAYCNRTDLTELFFFRPYPAFRIPSYPKAMFLDIDGTLLSANDKCISSDVTKKLSWLSTKCLLFLVTELPHNEAMRKIGDSKKYISGGVFAGGAHIKCASNEVFLPINYSFSDTELNTIKRNFSVKIRIYRHDNIIYKLTLMHNGKGQWTKKQAEKIKDGFKQLFPALNSASFHIDNQHIGITGNDVTKKSGVLMLCRQSGISVTDCSGAGNDKSDLPFLKLFPNYLFLEGRYK